MAQTNATSCAFSLVAAVEAIGHEGHCGRNRNGLEQTAIESSPKVAARKGRTPMMGALLLARACHGDPLVDEIAAEAPARLATRGATRRLAPEARARRTKAKGGAR